MFISDQDSFSVDEAIALMGPFTPTPTNSMATAAAALISPQPPPSHVSSLDNANLPTQSSTTSASQDNSSPNSKNLLPLILAPILALFGIAGLFVLWSYFYRRRKARRTAPSAEFKNYQRTSIPLADVEVSGGTLRGMRSMDIRPASYAYQPHNHEEADGDAPPAFTPGLFKDPIFEKGVAMSLSNQSGTWPGRHGTGAASVDVRTTERQDSAHTLSFAGGDSPASLSVLGHGQGQMMERQRLIPPEERY